VFSLLEELRLLLAEDDRWLPPADRRLPLDELR
jgi:hypothetical protein